MRQFHVEMDHGLALNGSNEETGLSREALSLYYDRFFPFSLISQWLTLSSSYCALENREFSFSVARGNDNYYLRWQSFQDPVIFRKRVLSMDPPPHKIDIGAVYSKPVRSKESASVTGTFIPVEKELVFDIDMNDYDDTRTCCQGKAVCRKCWKFLALAADVLEASLREDFGFKHIFWVFSGRRGIHGWVCDPAARSLPSDARACIADYLNLVTGTANQKKKVRLFRNVPHPMVRRAYERSLSLFQELVEEQAFFKRGSPLVEVVDTYMSGCRPEVKEEYFHKKATVWDETSLGLWELVLSCCLPRDKVTPIELLLSLCYPRLDINVSKDIGHLLKAPFCIHEATERVCIPIPSSLLKSFDPASAPRVTDIRREYLKGACVESSALASHIRFFQTEVVEPLLLAVTTRVPADIEFLQDEDEALEESLIDTVKPNSDLTPGSNLHQLTASFSVHPISEEW